MLCKAQDVPVQELVFVYTNSEKKLSILESLKGSQGWLQTKQISVSSFEMEDHILFAANDDNGNSLQPEQCHRVFSLEATIKPTQLHLSEEVKQRLKENHHSQQVGIIEDNRTLNHTFFDEEVDKLEKWSEDVRNSIKFEIKELDKEIKSRKTETRKLLNLEQKIKEQRIIKELEKKLADKRYNQYQNEDDIEKRKDDLLDEIEQRLKQNMTETELFTIRYRII